MNKFSFAVLISLLTLCKNSDKNNLTDKDNIHDQCMQDEKLKNDKDTLEKSYRDNCTSNSINKEIVDLPLVPHKSSLLEYIEEREIFNESKTINQPQIINSSNSILNESRKNDELFISKNNSVIKNTISQIPCKLKECNEISKTEINDVKVKDCISGSSESESYNVQSETCIGDNNKQFLSQNIQVTNSIESIGNNLNLSEISAKNNDYTNCIKNCKKQKVDNIIKPTILFDHVYKLQAKTANDNVQHKESNSYKRTSDGKNNSYYIDDFNLPSTSGYMKKANPNLKHKKICSNCSSEDNNFTPEEQASDTNKDNCFITKNDKFTEFINLYGYEFDSIKNKNNINLKICEFCYRKFYMMIYPDPKQLNLFREIETIKTFNTKFKTKIDNFGEIYNDNIVELKKKTKDEERKDIFVSKYLSILNKIRKELLKEESSETPQIIKQLSSNGFSNKKKFLHYTEYFILLFFDLKQFNDAINIQFAFTFEELLQLLFYPFLNLKEVFGGRFEFVCIWRDYQRIYDSLELLYAKDIHTNSTTKLYDFLSRNNIESYKMCKNIKSNISAIISNNNMSINNLAEKLFASYKNNISIKAENLNNILKELIKTSAKINMIILNKLNSFNLQSIIEEFQMNTLSNESIPSHLEKVYNEIFGHINILLTYKMLIVIKKTYLDCFESIITNIVENFFKIVSEYEIEVLKKKDLIETEKVSKFICDVEIFMNALRVVDLMNDIIYTIINKYDEILKKLYPLNQKKAI